MTIDEKIAVLNVEMRKERELEAALEAQNQKFDALFTEVKSDVVWDSKKQEYRKYEGKPLSAFANFFIL